MFDEDLPPAAREGEYWYVYPLLLCKRCKRQMHLPYPDLPRTDQDLLFLSSEIDQLELPEGEWSAIFVCPKCGLVAARGTRN